MNATESMKEILLRMGASWLLWLLALLSLVSMVIVVERWLFFRARGTDLRSLAQRLDGWLSAGHIDQAIEGLSSQPAVAAQIAAAGLRLANRGPESADKAMQSAVALERARLERWLAYLGTVGNNAPFVGLFGTVAGVIGAFEHLGSSGAGAAASAAGSAGSAAVMSSLAEALVATAVGLLVALPAVAFYNYFQRRIASLLSGSEVVSNLVLAYLSTEER